MILTPSPRLPVLFIGHGSPMNAIEDNAWRRTWQDLGAELRAQARPQLILCISAHWLTQDGAYLTGMAQPRTIHDFGGFPRELYEVQYPAPGAPEVAQALAAELGLGVDDGEWGLDHGAWGVLQPMFPAADIPVIQLSMDYARPPAEHFALGRKLRGLRERGVLIVGSGNVVHNLRAMRRGTGINAAYDWAQAFDQQVTELVRAGRLADLAQFQQWGHNGQLAQLAHPSHEHFLPLLHAAGAVEEGEEARFFNTGFQAASISMRSMLWASQL